MQFSFSDEQNQFRDAVQRFIRDTAPISAARQLINDPQGFDRDVWRRMHDELGLGGIHIAETHGGLGFGTVELGIVCEEMGRSLVCSPFLGSSVLAAGALIQCSSEADVANHLPKIISGECIASLAIAETSGHWQAEAVRLVANPDGDDYRLTGAKSFVLDAHVADLLLVAARQPESSAADGVSLFAVAADIDGVTVRPLAAIDTTRRLGEINFNNARASLIGELGHAAAPLNAAIDQARIALANEMVGGAQALLDASVEYASLRMQFGRLIGSFQAIKHKCAELLLDVELAKSAAYYACEAADEGASDLAATASLAKTVAAEAYMHAAIEAIQIHGGIGFTWDNDTHLWYRRAKSSEVLFGDPSEQRERYIGELERAL